MPQPPSSPSSGRRATPPIVAPSRSDRLLSRFTELVGGPFGARGWPGASGRAGAERVLIVLTTAAALVAVLAKTPCRVNGWHTPSQFYMGCYSDWPSLFASRGWADSAPLFGQGVEYPVLLAFIAGVTALLVTGHGDPAAAAYFDINMTLIAAVWIVTVVATARMHPRRPYDAAMVAVAPGIILAGTINWDLWAVMFTALAMLAFARSRPILAGVLLGLGIAVKLYPVLILGAIALLALRSGRYRNLLRTGLATAATWVAVNLPYALIDFDAWSRVYTYSATRGAGYSSLWYGYNLLVERLRGAPGMPQLPGLDAGFINGAALLLMVLACAGITLLTLTAPRPPRLAQLAFLLVASLVLVNKVYSPQFVVWLIPLAVLARPRWRDFLLWQAAEVLHWWAIWLYLGRVTSNGPPEHNIADPYYVLAIVVHMVATAYLMVRVAAEIWRPDRDELRRGHPGGSYTVPVATAAQHLEGRDR